VVLGRASWAGARGGKASRLELGLLGWGWCWAGLDQGLG
jgi:hypothetical protein